MTRRRLILLLLLAIAAWLALFGDKTPPDPANDKVVPAVAPRSGGTPAGSVSSLAVRDSRPTMAPAASGSNPARPEVAALVDRAQLIPAAAEEQEARDVFPALSWTPPPPKPDQPARPLPPMAPPLPFVYLGKKQEAGVWEAYLGRGEEVFIVREGMLLEGRYRVQAINPPNLTLTYLPLKQSQTLSIGGAP